LGELNSNAIHDWLKDPVTELFFGFVQYMKKDNEEQIFAKLQLNDHFSASNYSAAREEDIMIMTIPERVVDAIEDIRDEKKAAKEANEKGVVH